jgi:outer membrane protein OmpU
MNKLKKAGLTALAGSLAAFSANAAEMGVSGGVNLTYVSDKGVTGNPYGMETRLTFAASGETENGLGVSYYTTMENHYGTGQYSGELAVDFGDLGKLALQQGVGNAGIDQIDDMSVKAYEEAWDGLTATQGLVNTGGTNVFKYTNSFSGVGLNAAYRKGSDTGNAEGDNSDNGEGTGYSFALTAGADTLGVEGLNAGFGYGEIEEGQVQVVARGELKDKEYYALYTTYAIGPVSLSAQRNRITAIAKDVEADYLAVAFNVNDSLAISYATIDIDHQNTGSTANVSEEVDGMGVSYTMGGMTIGAQRNEADHANGVKNATDEHSEITVSFSF